MKDIASANFLEPSQIAVSKTILLVIFLQLDFCDDISSIVSLIANFILSIFLLHWSPLGLNSLYPSSQGIMGSFFLTLDCRVHVFWTN